MNTQHADWYWLDEHEVVGLAELARMSGMQVSEVVELVDDGVLVPSSGRGPDACFTGDFVHPLREAARMRSLFDLDLFTVGLLTGYLHRIEVLEQQVRALRARVPPHLHPGREGPGSWREPHAREPGDGEGEHG